MTQDFADFLAALNSEGVSYVVIGGIAVLFHVPYRTTRDIDVLIAPTLENAQRAHTAVKSWGGFEPEFSPQDFISGDTAGRPENDLPDLRRLRQIHDDEFS